MTFNLEVKDFDDEKGQFRGLLSVYDVVDGHGDVVERGAYTKTLQESGGNVPLLWHHNPASPIGTLSLKDGTDGLEAEGRLILDDAVPDAKRAYALLKAGVVKGLSIGYRAIKKRQEDKIRRLKEVQLFEGSLVTMPANRFALVTSVKALESKDFLSELDRLQTQATYWNMLSALSNALDRIRYGDGTREERIATASTIVQQFAESFIDYIPRLMDAMGVKLDASPQQATEKLAETQQQALELERKHSGTEETAVGADATVETKTVEPGNHSINPAWLESYLKGW